MFCGFAPDDVMVIVLVTTTGVGLVDDLWQAAEAHVRPSQRARRKL